MTIDTVCIFVCGMSTGALLLAAIAVLSGGDE